ncbi:MAG TPA: hypothetical protein VMR86_00360 [Myxococcota bacterium]|nr:hypothetical protein [Myxococcota bacterium]
MRWLTGIVLGFVIGCVVSSSGQQAGPPPSQAEQYLRQVGMREALERQHDQNAAASKEQISQIVDQLAEQAQLPPDVRTGLQSMYSEMVEAVQNSYTVDEALAVYARAWDRNYPGDDFQIAKAQLATPEGRRLMRAANEAVSDTAHFIQQRRQAALQRETTKLVEHVRELGKKYPAR